MATKETVDEYSIRQWLEKGRAIATQPQYYGRLTDMNGDNQGDFDYIFFFADQSKPDVVNICTANRKLKKRNAKGVSDRDLKSLLGDFISYTDMLFKNSDTATQVRDWLVSHNSVPNWDDIVKKREGASHSYQNESEYKDSFWKRANNFISDIGDTMESVTEVGLDVAPVILLVGIVIIGIISVIGTWINDGFGMAILTGIIAAILGTIAFYVGAIAIYLIRFLLILPRLFFKNIYWFIGVLLIWLIFVVIPAF